MKLEFAYKKSLVLTFSYEQTDVQPGKHKWIPDVAFLKWKGF